MVTVCLRKLSPLIKLLLEEDSAVKGAMKAIKPVYIAPDRLLFTLVRVGALLERARAKRL